MQPKTWSEQKVPDLPNSIFVFGSNDHGKHGKGAALTAKLEYGAKIGQPEGLQGRSYAIVTKAYKDIIYRSPKSSIKLSAIQESIRKFYIFAANNPHLNFYVTKIGCGLSGFSEEEIGALFRSNLDIYPQNIFLPKVFA